MNYSKRWKRNYGEMSEISCDELREKARDSFKPLTWKDINQNDWNDLISIVERYIKKKNEAELAKEKIYRNYIMKIGHVHFGNLTDKSFTAFIKVKLDNYTEREGITFYSDGYIGFAGWADKENLTVFTDAFCEWTKVMKKRKYCIEIRPEEVVKIDHTKYAPTVLGVPGRIVEQLPENPKLGEVVVMKGKTYLFTGGDKPWDRLYNPDALLSEIREVVKKSEDCKLRRELIEILL